MFVDCVIASYLSGCFRKIKSFEIIDIMKLKIIFYFEKNNFIFYSLLTYNYFTVGKSSNYIKLKNQVYTKPHSKPSFISETTMPLVTSIS